MVLKINIPQPSLLRPKISVFGVGGAGGNALNNMIKSNLEGVEFIAANTDAQALSHSLAANRIQLGINTTKGLGAGSFPDRGRAAAEGRRAATRFPAQAAGDRATARPSAQRCRQRITQPRSRSAVLRRPRAGDAGADPAASARTYAALRTATLAGDRRP